ncbi:7-carboxy-7-deazaguanine synthase QueE [Aliivibrio fischeri]|uniref:7-carboxy-7-deazaguanine synthase QueE n=1 Tax=Aliivibrio fischeri TaxID=668 RepID=UPI0007C46A64|nr:7-carboxy-7-deazaguanine synthase QueE [Aliivibrio fischeri]
MEGKVLLKVNEIFETIQGEGYFSGHPSIFIRLQGCKVGCSWCDTKHTWNVKLEQQITCQEVITKSEESEQWCNCSVSDIWDIFQTLGFKSKHVVITGGEPCDYDLIELTTFLESKDLQCQIETSGTSLIRVSPNSWVTVSPKINMQGKLTILDSALARANEIKHPVGTEKDVNQLKTLLREYNVSKNTKIYLQPISQKIRATDLCIKACIDNNWALSVQIHKFLNIN